MTVSLEAVTEAATEAEGEEEVPMTLIKNFALYVILKDTLTKTVNLIPQRRKEDS